MATNKSTPSAADKMYKSEGAPRPPKWERARAHLTSWCNFCHDYTEHDHMGCVECYDPVREEETPEAAAGDEDAK